MNSRERILTALEAEQPDRVPIFELYINESSIVRLARLLAPEMVEVEAEKDRFGEERQEVLDLYCLLVKELDLDATCTNFSIGIEVIDENVGRDKYGTIYQLSGHGEPMPIEGPIEGPEDLAGFDMVSRLEGEDFAGVRYVVDAVGPEKAHFVSVTDPFKVSWRRRGGMQHLLMDYVLRPQFVHDLARISTDFDRAAIDLAVEAGVDVIVVPGDLAGELTTIMSPEHYRDYIKPYHKEMVDYAHRRGLKIVKHTDGNVWPILDDLLDVGFDGIHPIQPQCMDIVEVKEHVAGRACILGNIDCRELLPFGTEEEVEAVVRETIEKAAPGGGYIISSSNSIHPGCKPENYVAMVKAAHRYGDYS
ncbi:MAG: uroporphyrinogen decarboxylase family protein [Anaerolineales bacterium]